MIRELAGALIALAAPVAAEPFHLIPGAIPAGKGPDGNTIIFDAPNGLVVFDTGRHPEHAAAILDYARRRHRPIAAIVNSPGTSITRPGTGTCARPIRMSRSMRATRSKARSRLI